MKNLKFKNLRKLKFRTQKELALAINKKSATIAKWEEGKSMPKSLDLPIVADALGVSLADVIVCFKR